MAVYCCTCAAPLPAGTSDKKLSHVPEARQLPCCGRFICGRCVETNARFASYCPYCQIASDASPSQHLLPPGLRPPPPYQPGRVSTTTAAETADAPPPPPYALHASELLTNTHLPASSAALDDEKGHPPSSSPSSCADDIPILHYLDHDRDSVMSLALRYNVPADALRRANRLAADHLLLGRRVVEIPRLPSSASAQLLGHSSSSSFPASSASFSSPIVSLSPNPVEGELESRRKAQIRRFMVACKVADYDLAVLYLDQTAAASDADAAPSYDLAAAIAAYQADDLWERQNPQTRQPARLKNKNKGKRHISLSSSAADRTSSFLPFTRRHQPPRR